MKLIPRPSGRTRLKRRIVAVSVAIDFAALAILAVLAVVSHHRGSLIAVAVLLLGAVCGLNYLRSTGGRR